MKSRVKLTKSDPKLSKTEKNWQVLGTPFLGGWQVIKNKTGGNPVLLGDPILGFERWVCRALFGWGHAIALTLVAGAAVDAGSEVAAGAEVAPVGAADAAYACVAWVVDCVCSTEIEVVLE